MSTIHYTNCPLCESTDLSPYLTIKDHSISREVFDLLQCSACSFVFTQDVPTPQAIAPYYKGENYISHSDSREGLANKLYHIARNVMLSKKYQLIKKANRTGKHLDYGAGTGYFVKYLKDKGLSADGVEIDSNARSYATKQHGIQLIAPEALLSGTASELYDTISMWHVLEHIHDLDQLLGKLLSLMTREGTLFVAVPNHTSTDGQKYGAYWAGYDVPRHLWHFSPKTMQAVMTNNGLQVIDMQAMLFDPYYNSMLSERYMGHSAALLRGSVSGVANTLAGVADTEKSSSIIYTIKKQ